jgi:hypothetical protein
VRRERSFLILLVLGVALGAYIYFVERHRSAGDAPEPTPKVFEDIEASQIEELLVVANQRTRLRKSDGRWQIVEPMTVEADEGEASSLASSLATLDQLEVVDESPSSLAEFGLDPPRGEVGFRTEGSTELRRLLLGSRAPTGTGMYAKLPDDPRLLLIPAYVETTFSRSTFDLRDKVVLKFEREAVDGLEVSTAGRVIRLTRASGDWRLVEPLAVRADYGTAESTVGRLATAQMRSVVSTETPDTSVIRKYGLDRPALTATVVSGSSRATLQIGGQDDEGNRYARDVSRPLVFTVDETLVTELQKPAGQFRRRDVFEFRPFNATRLEITRDGQTMAFEKVKPAEEGAEGTEAWRQTAPAERDLEIGKMDALLSALSNVRAETWSDGKGQPQMVATVRFDEDRQERLTFWRTGDDVHVARADEPGAAVISTPDYENVLRALDDVLK